MIKRSSISYVYAGLFLISILIILTLNSYFLIEKTRSNLIEIYWRQGEIIIKSIAVSARQSIDSVKLTPQQIIRHIRKTALKIDEISSTTSPAVMKEEITDILRESLIRSVSFIDGNGKRIMSVIADQTVGRRRDSSRVIDIRRSKVSGTIRLVFGERKLADIKAQIGLHLLIASLEDKNIVQIMSFLNDRFQIIADTDPTRVGTVEERLEYLDAINSGVSFFSRKDDFMEIIHPIFFSQREKGVLKISYPLTKIDEIYENTFKNTVTNSGIVMILAIIAAIIAIKVYQRSLIRIDNMERKIRENEKLISLANLTAGIAHEVRNPLNSISITIQRLQLEFTPKRKKDLDEYVSLTALMKGEVDRINMIITDFLDFAKPFEPKITKFSIDEFLEGVLTLFSVEAEKRGVSINKRINARNTKFHGDREKLTQVIINLLHNALEAAPLNGEIIITSSILKNSHWELKIQDNGPGISRENLNRIYDIYFTTKKSGTGLGLYISRKIIQAHKGSIELTSGNAQGTTVTITLPGITY